MGCESNSGCNYCGACGLVEINLADVIKVQAIHIISSWKEGFEGADDVPNSDAVVRGEGLE